MALRYLSPTDADAAGAVLARAFFHEPSVVYLLPDMRERAELAAGIFAMLTRLSAAAGGALGLGDPLAAVSLSLPPGQSSPKAQELTDAGFADLPTLWGPEATRRVETLREYLDAAHERLMPEPHWYVMFVGVDPPFQGRGIGHSLMQPTLDAADAAGVPAYLETADEGTVRFYLRLGFCVLEHGLVPGTELPIWLMRRDPVNVRDQEP